MRNVKALLCATVLLSMMACAMWSVSGPTTAAGEKGTDVGNHWRHHEGRWDYWHNGDRRWYHTDGSNWFYNDGTAWNLYGFDKQFGREGFEKGDYKTPATEAKIVTPGHAVYRAPTK